MAYPSTLFSSGTQPTDTLGPKSILGDVIRSLYDSFNRMFEQFGVSIPEVAMGAMALVLLLLGWSIVNGIRNRKSFSLEDDPDDDVSKVNGSVGSRVLRPQGDEEGTPGAVA